MTNELVVEKSGWKKHWKWLTSIFVMLIVCVSFFFSSGMNKITSDITNAYVDTDLYDNALDKIKSNDTISKLIGTIQPLDKLAILEGQVQYTNDNKNVATSIRIIGSKGKGMMDISAFRKENKWVYSTINFRIKNPPEQSQTIDVLLED